MPISHPTHSDHSFFLLNECLNEIKNQGINPPGNDPVIGSCYQAFLKTINENKAIYDILAEIVMLRGYTPAHFANILFRSVQYIELYHRGKNNYPTGFDDEDVWKAELMAIFNESLDLLKHLLTTKDTTTTIYQRYAGSKIILSALFRGETLNVADLGCGGNYGLPGLIKNVQFDTIQDNTANKFATRLLANKTLITNGLAIDKENPYTADAFEWRFACSFYPQELQKEPKIILPNHTEGETVFTRIDLTSAESNPEIYNIPLSFYNAVIMSTFLYQLTYNQISTVMDFAKKIVTNNGVIIIQDFATVNPANEGEITLIKNWFSLKNPYRTFIVGEQTNWKIKEILLWTNGRCKEVSEGIDFDYIAEK